MIFKKFILKFIYSILFIVITVILFNYYMDPFGLFKDVENKNLRVYAAEKSTKYLYSFNYIPKNFNGILVGPSFSDQMMDTKKIVNHKIYNLSMDGGNISELKFAIDNVLKYGNIKTFIICLDPYITKNSGTKSSQINPKEYYASLGSRFIFNFYKKKLSDIRKGNKSIYYDSYWGYTDNEYRKKDENSTYNIEKRLDEYNKNKEIDLKINEVAYNELKEILFEVRKRKIKILAYYYPKPKRIFNQPNYRSQYLVYRNKIDKLLDYEKDIIIDFATDGYDYIRNNDNSYSDGGHLSRIGANKILKIINEKLN